MRRYRIKKERPEQPGVFETCPTVDVVEVKGGNIISAVESLHPSPGRYMLVAVSDVNFIEIDITRLWRLVTVKQEEITLAQTVVVEG